MTSYASARRVPWAGTLDWNGIQIGFVGWIVNAKNWLDSNCLPGGMLKMCKIIMKRFWATGNCGGIKDKCHGVNENVVVVAERLQKMIKWISL